MASIVRMPSPLAGTAEAAVQTWLTSEGAQISAGDPLAEIETEKAVVEYAAEVSGTVARLLVEPGDNVAVGTPIAVVTEPGEGDDAVRTALAAAGADEQGAAAGGAPAPTVTDQPAAPEPETAPAQPASGAPDAAGTSAPPAEPAAQAPAESAEASSGSTGKRLFASPLVRRLARERGIDLTRVRGTGPAGRIVRRDLEQAVASAEQPESAPARPSAPAAAPAPAPAEDAGYVDVPLTGMRRAIARRLTESVTTAPHFFVRADCRVDELLELRRKVNAAASRKVSVNDFVLKAAAAALTRVPAANAVWNGDSIRRFEHVDLAVAVAVENGLLTPVVRGVDRLPLTEISARVADLAERARAGRLQQHELEGGSFSISNLGMYGVDEFSAILNPPQSGILAVGAAKQRAIVVDGALAVGTVMTVTLSADHRVVDGALAAEWMAAFVELIENPLSILV